jgi:MFS family permease
VRLNPRYTVLCILCGASLFSYLDRMVMASAIPFIASDFHLSPLQMGGVLSAFFLGYAAMQIPGGLLADRFGPRIVVTGSIAWFSLMTAMSGLVPGLLALLVVRTLFGLGEGPYPSAASKAVSRWFPAGEWARANGWQLGATGVGATLAPLLVVALLPHGGWRCVFFLLCAPGLLLAFLVWRYVGNAPAGGGGGERATTVPVGRSLRESLRTPAVRWLALSLFLFNIVNWGLMNWLPTYLLQARGFGVEKMGMFAAITNGAGVAGSVIGGYACDRYFARNLRWPIVWGLLLSAGLTWVAAVAPSGESAVACLVLVFLLSNIATTAIFTLPLLVVPSWAVGGAFGIVNTAGQLAGVLSPLIVGEILQLTHGSFEMVLYSMVVLTFVSVLPAMRIRQREAAT